MPWHRRVAILAALSLGLLAPAIAGAATPGVNIAGPPETALVDQAIATGAKSVRIFATWNGFEPTARGEYPPTSSSSDSLKLRKQVFDDGLLRLNAAGVKPVYVLIDTPGWANGGAGQLNPPSDPADFAAFAGRFAAHNKAIGGQVLGYEIWNEADSKEFFHPGPSPSQYTAMLQASYRTIKAADPAASVIASPTTGNNAEWMRQLYGAGAGGYFDAAAVHTDTACLVASPDYFYREESGDIGQFSFLGYRTVHQVMTENGDGGKPILMTEVGWSATGGAPNSCQRGVWAGQKADGVTEAEQAQFLTKAFACMANDPYLTDALWFTLLDTTIYSPAEMNHYGLIRTNGTKKPAYDAFRAAAAKNGGAAGECGDFEAPAIQPIKPAPGEQFVDKLDISSTAADLGVGMHRVSYTFDGGQKIRNFEASAGVDFSQQMRQAPWYGAKNLALGPHTIEITAKDKNGNERTVTIPVVKVADFAATLLPSMAVKSKGVRCKKRVCQVSGQLKRGKAGSPTIDGKVAVEWQFRNKKGKWRKLVGGLKPAHKPFTFKAKVKFAGRWRVRMSYLGKAPWKPTRSKYLYFRI